MLRCLLIFILCGTLAACVADQKSDFYWFNVKMDTGEDATLVCVQDPTKAFGTEPNLVGDYQLMADGKSYLVPPESPESIHRIYSPVDAEPCKSLIERQAVNTERQADNIERDANISAGEAGEAAAAITAGILLGILICVPTLGVLC
ncbi:hypothetical protein [Ruegeria sp. HKCCD7255]|uniref:hypothetical protein n=1 Tax=Ruegeria sp. HKCCD7255 TaxID=2683004 RepID=UPI00148958FF|nr:hypothetical protein [Ruegeria sp. HKCCD7255]